MTAWRIPLALVLWGLVAAAKGSAQSGTRDVFDHEKHRKLFPECQGCHVGITETGQSIYPAPEACAGCHDGSVKKKVNWSPPPSRPSNFRFTHAEHIRKSGLKLPADSTIACTACHTPTGAPWLTIRRTISAQCLDCHRIQAPHTSAPDTACGTCHVPLTEARALPVARVAAFEKPASHGQKDFVTSKGHGALAKAGDRSCAVCHARDFCTQCHVNAPEVRAIQALAPDPRSLALKAVLKAPATHQVSSFLIQHGQQAKRDVTRCAYCHTQESCVACHRTAPRPVLQLASGGPGRAIGARIDRKKPASHFADFADRHSPVASASPATCSACHARAECLECHRPNAAASGGYHPAGFLTRHPATAYDRQADCSACHNRAAFCVSCHQQAGLGSGGRPLRQGYHDANGAFAMNHGVAARQNIESCVACHSERDCLLCHSAQGGRRFNPHGPGFDAKRLRARNPQTCAACHGPNIPGGG
jgi:hypothetical protein